MSTVRDAYAPGRFGLSFEIFPPKTDAGENKLRETLRRLATYDPQFISCTYGAGGSTRTKTLDWCSEIQNDFDQTATAHFTCVGSTRDDLTEWLTEAESRGIRNIMALRGDAPQGADGFQVTKGGFGYASELVCLIRERFPDFGIGVAGYPERHPESADDTSDLKWLKHKIDCGGDAVYTQLFYVNELFYRFRDACDQAGISVPLVPGIMPITDYKRITRIVEISGTVVPEELIAALKAAHERDDVQAQQEIGIDFAIKQCQDLIDHDVPGIHFYVLNKATACERILDNLDLAPAAVS